MADFMEIGDVSLERKPWEDLSHCIDSYQEKGDFVRPSFRSVDPKPCKSQHLKSEWEANRQ